MKKKTKKFGLPCPFCGAIRQRLLTDIDGKPELDEPFCALTCANKECPVKPTVTGDTDAECAAKWDTRSAGTAAVALERIDALLTLLSEKPTVMETLAALMSVRVIAHKALLKGVHHD